MVSRFVRNLLFLTSLTSLTSFPVAIAAPSLNITDLIPLIPPCAIPCILQGLSEAPDALSNPAVSCGNINVQSSISTCVQQVCSYTEQAQLAGVNSKLCDGFPIDESRRWALFIVETVAGSLSVAAILLRTYSRYAITRHMGGDDWTMLVAGILMIGIMTAGYIGHYRSGFGLHYWNLDPSRIPELLQVFYAAEIFYIIEITLIKVSILQFYLRVFPSQSLRIANYITLTLVVSACIGILIPIIVQCNPVAAAWDRTITNAKCININLLAYATGGIGVGLDIVILALPIPELLKLKMSQKRKIHVLFMFSLGSVACVTSMVRLKYLAQFEKSTDPTFDNVIPTIWSFIEICTAIICACLPALRALFTHYNVAMFGSSSTTTRTEYYDQRTSNNTSANRRTFTGGWVATSKFSSGSGSRTVDEPGAAVAAGGGGVGASEKNIPLGTVTSPGARSSWFNKDRYITHNREVGQDVERSPRISHGGHSHHQPAASFDTALKRNNTTNTNTSSMATRIWVDETASTLHPLRSHSSMKSSEISKDDHSKFSGFHFGLGSPGRLGRRPESALEPASPRRLEGSQENEIQLEQQITRDGSEDSIFVLEGPRVSDDEHEREGQKFERSRGEGSSRPGTSGSRPDTSGSMGAGAVQVRRSTSLGNRYNGPERDWQVLEKSRSNASRPGTSGSVGAAPSEPRRSTSRGNRYDEQGHLRRNRSLDLRGGEVRIPVSVFSTQRNW